MIRGWGACGAQIDGVNMQNSGGVNLIDVTSGVKLEFDPLTAPFTVYRRLFSSSNAIAQQQGTPEVTEFHRRWRWSLRNTRDLPPRETVVWSAP